MMVRARVGFVSTIDGVKYRVEAGHEIEMPKGADWVKAGLAEAVAPPPKPAAKRKKTAKK